MIPEEYDALVIGGGPSGATAADDLARGGRRVLLLDRGGRIKPCGGAIPPRLIRDFAIPDHLIVGRATAARMVAPSDKHVDMAVGGYVGMVDRAEFDEWLRARAAKAGAERRAGSFERIERGADGVATVIYKEGRNGAERRVRAKAVIGADGARSQVAKQEIKHGDRVPCVFAYHEIIRSPAAASAPQYADDRADVYYQGHLSPDFYAWIFPHGDTASVGVGSARKGFGLRQSVETLRRATGLDGCETVRREGAPIPLKPLGRWDNGRDVVVAGDAAGVVAPASGEGIYYAMLAGRFAADAVEAFLATGKRSALRRARSRFMREHGRVFWVLRMMQYFWYSSDRRRERFVAMCADADVQRLTWQAYMEKKLVRARPGAHARIFFKGSGPSVRIVRMMLSARSWPLPMAVAAAAAVAVAVMGATVTDLGPWYHMLRQPRWAPPDVAYGAIWTVIYALNALAAASAWIACGRRRDGETLIGLFALNGFLNIVWSLLFFRFHRPDLAALEAVALWLSVLSLVIFGARRSRPAAIMLLPYLAWVSIALTLNLAVVRLNGPFA